MKQATTANRIANKPIKPNFLIIGAQKSATTWLRDALDLHPDVFMATGEPQFFNRDAEDIDSYYRHFAAATGQRAVGEKTPDYLHMSSLRIRRLRETLGNVKLLAVLRKPEDRAWSQARMEASAFNRDSFGKKAESRLARNVISYRNRDRCRYADHLRRWMKYFDRDRLMVRFYEEITEDPADLVRQVFQWLDVSPDRCETLPPPIWQSPEADRPREISRYLQMIHGDEPERLRAIGISPPEQWGDHPPASRPTVPLVAQRLLMLAPNAAYRLYDQARGAIPGRYWRTFNRVFHNHVLSRRVTPHGPLQPLTRDR